MPPVERDAVLPTDQIQSLAALYTLQHGQGSYAFRLRWPWMFADGHGILVAYRRGRMAWVCLRG